MKSAREAEAGENFSALKIQHIPRFHNHDLLIPFRVSDLLSTNTPARVSRLSVLFGYLNIESEYLSNKSE